jgi:hypothetical protein
MNHRRIAFLIKAVTLPALTIALLKLILNGEVRVLISGILCGLISFLGSSYFGSRSRDDDAEFVSTGVRKDDSDEDKARHDKGVLAVICVSFVVSLPLILW